MALYDLVGKGCAKLLYARLTCELLYTGSTPRGIEVKEVQSFETPNGPVLINHGTREWHKLLIRDPLFVRKLRWKEESPETVRVDDAQVIQSGFSMGDPLILIEGTKFQLQTVEKIFRGLGVHVFGAARALTWLPAPAVMEDLMLQLLDDPRGSKGHKVPIVLANNPGKE